MNCPKCQAPLSRVEFDGVKVRKCNQCGGELVGQSALERLALKAAPTHSDLQMETVFAVAAQSDTSSALACPMCLRRMSKLHFRDYEDLRFDYCDECKSYWLDAGEMEKMRIRVADRFAGLSPEQRRRYEKLRQVRQALDLRQMRHKELRDEPVAGPVGPGPALPGSCAGLFAGLFRMRRTLTQEQERHDEIDRETVDVLCGHPPPHAAYVPWQRFRKPLLVVVIILDLIAMAVMVFRRLSG